MSEPRESVPESERDRLFKVLQDTCAKLGEHFDSVRIFATRHDPVNSKSWALDYGMGNMYAQIGQVKDFVILQDEYVREEARKK